MLLCLGVGVPWVRVPPYHPDLAGGGTLDTPTIQTWPGGVPQVPPTIQTWDGVPPHLRHGMGYPPPQTWDEVPPPHHPDLARVAPRPDLTGVPLPPPSRPDWGTPRRRGVD